MSNARAISVWHALSWSKVMSVRVMNQYALKSIQFAQDSYRMSAFLQWMCAMNGVTYFLDCNKNSTLSLRKKEKIRVRYSI
jgi:uncharacterized protein YaeQ